MLIQVLATGTNFDTVDPENKTGWDVSPQAKLDRLLREKQIPTGLLFNGRELRLVYAPRGESSGFLTFPLDAMLQVSGRLILGAMEMLLGVDRVFGALEGRRLTDLLVKSRDYQNDVSIHQLASQVVDALWELLSGFQSANIASNGRLLGDLITQNPQHIYGGLIAILLRLVFLLYAEDEGLMPNDEIYERNYAITGLFEKLRTDEGNYPDTMDQRFGAYAWLLSLFRLVYDGGGHIPQYLSAKKGDLFNPHSYPFLEGNWETGPYHGEGPYQMGKFLVFLTV
jgi:hypothetical protein